MPPERAMAALTRAGLAHAPDKAPTSLAASTSQDPARAGDCSPTYCATAQPHTSTIRPQAATTAAHRRLRAGDDRCGFGYRTGGVDTIATSSLTLWPRSAATPDCPKPTSHRAIITQQACNATLRKSPALGRPATPG